MIGHAVVTELTRRGIDCVSPTHSELDVLDFKKLRSAIGAQYDMVVHCAAWTDVRSAELTENRDAVYALNVDVTRYIAKYCGWAGVPMIYLSTNYVFGGVQAEPYKPGQRCCPISWYGQTKRDGEKFVERMDKSLIVRTSWVYGDYRDVRWARSIVGGAIKFLENRMNGEMLCGYTDRICTPTYVEDLAKELVDRGLDLLSTTEVKDKLIHYTNSGTCTLYKLMELITQCVGLDPDNVVCPALMRDVKNPTYPVNGALDISATKWLKNDGHEREIPIWEERVKQYVERITNEFHLSYQHKAEHSEPTESVSDHSVQE